MSEPQPQKGARRRLPISDDVIEHLRSIGASKDSILFAERLVSRYSRVELEHAQWRSFVMGLIASWTAVLVVWLVANS